ncbi:hypothetical protein S245_035744, partial [Arachis hypogaea]
IARKAIWRSQTWIQKAPKDRSMTKNVAEEIAEKLCESMAASLEGKKLASFTRISSTVHVRTSLPLNSGLSF